MKYNFWDGKKTLSTLLQVLFLFMMLLATSCSTIVYRSKGRLPISFDKTTNHRREVILKGKKEFYLWGLIPNRHYVYIDEVAKDAGLKELSRVEIYEKMTVEDSILTIITLGLYTPASYQIEAMTIKSR